MTKKKNSEVFQPIPSSTPPPWRLSDDQLTHITAAIVLSGLMASATLGRRDPRYLESEAAAMAVSLHREVQAALGPPQTPQSAAAEAKLWTELVESANMPGKVTA